MKLIFSEKSFFVLIFIGGLLFSSESHAQDRLPKIQQLNQEERIELPPLSRRFSGYQGNNAYLDDTLQLQYQISLLEKMIQRQGSISRLEKNYKELGLPFEQPQPARGICEQIPANIPCHRTYPDLYDIVLPQVSQLDLLIEEPLTMDMLGGDVSQPAAQAKVVQKDVSIILSDQYKWAEVLCGGGVCSAVLIKDGNTGKRTTVSEGDILEAGKIEILEITSKGVRVKERGQETSLSPALAPAQGGPASPILAGGDDMGGSLFTSEEPSETLSSGRARLTDNPVPSSSIQSPPKEKLKDLRQSVEESENFVDPGPPPLGPTGLF